MSGPFFAVRFETEGASSPYRDQKTSDLDIVRHALLQGSLPVKFQVTITHERVLFCDCARIVLNLLIFCVLSIEISTAL